jgi:hypothetical protein
MSRYTSKKKGLTKVEKKQTIAITKKVVNQMVESKYFNTNPNIARQVSSPAWRNGNINSEIAVFGYTTGFRNNTNSDGDESAMTYGVNAITGNVVSVTSLDMNRVFTTSNSAPQRASYSVVGSSIRPAYNECQWLIDRVQGNVALNEDNGLNYKIRMIRVVPRALKGSFQSINPKADLFLDQYNEPFGISTTNASGQNVFGEYEFHLAKVNSRRYVVKADKILTMNPSNLGQVDSLFTVNVVNESQRKFKTTHHLGKELFYSSPNDTSDLKNTYPDTGFENEYILFHVIATGNPETNTYNRITPGLLHITCRPVSTFKDA